MIQGIMETLPSWGSPPFPGTEQAVPGRAPVDAPRSPSSAAVPLLSLGILGLLCGTAVSRLRGRRGSGGGRKIRRAAGHTGTE